MIQILCKHILFLFKNIVTILPIAWQQSWCDIGKGQTQTIRGKIAAKHILLYTDLDYELITFIELVP